MRISHTEIIGALRAALERRGLGAERLRLLPIDPPRPWGAASNACFMLGQQAAAAAIERETAGLDKKAAKQLASELSKAAGEQLASEIARELNGLALPFIAKVEAEGAYINFYYDIPAVVGHVVASAVSGGAAGSAGGAGAIDGGTGARDGGTGAPPVESTGQGAGPTGGYGAGAPTGQRIMVEYAQPNTHKDFHVGHLRNASIGQAIANLLEFAGNDVLKATYIGDVGAHVAGALVLDDLIASGHLYDVVRHLSGAEVDLSFDSKDRTFISLGDIDYSPSAYEVLGKLKRRLNNITEAIDRVNNHLKDLQKQWMIKWEANDPQTRRNWQITRDFYVDELSEIFAELHVSFTTDPDCWFFESTVDDTKLGQKTAAELKALGIAEVDESAEYKGALYVDFAKHVDAVRPGGAGAPPANSTGQGPVPPEPCPQPVFRDDEKKRIRQLGKMTILRSDGTSLYQTKELGLAKHKFDLVAERFGAPLSESLYVVGAEQKLYFEQVFAILRLWGFPNAERCKHIAYELVVLPEGKMSSREGNIVSYRELRDEAVKRAEEITREKGIGAAGAGGAVDEAKVKDIARKIAIAAIKYAMLKVTGAQQIVFDFEEALSFNGRTAPYLQYAYARAGKLLGANATENVGAGSCPGPSDVEDQTGGDKAPPLRVNNDTGTIPAYPLHESEVELARQLSLFPGVCAEAAAKYEPATLCSYLYDLADAFSGFYRDCRVLDAPPAEREFRRRLVAAFRNVVRTGFTLLALPLPEEM